MRRGPAADRYGAKVVWAEVDIETAELPPWQWENLITKGHPIGRHPVGVGDAGDGRGISRPVAELVHDAGGLVIVDHPPVRPTGCSISRNPGPTWWR